MNDLLVMARIADRRCAFRADHVQSVIELGDVTPIPCAPDFVAGITALRSQALTVIDCRRAIGIDPRDLASDDRAIVVSIAGYSYALVVDEIEDVTTAIEEVDEVAGGYGEKWSRIASTMVETSAGPALLIDLGALIAGPENFEAVA